MTNKLQKKGGSSQKAGAAKKVSRKGEAGKRQYLSAVPSTPVQVQPTLVSQVMSPLKAVLAKQPTPKAASNDQFVTVQATHNLMNQRKRKETGDIMIINNLCGVNSEQLESAVQDGTNLAGRVLNVLWNIPAAYSTTTTDGDDTITTITHDTRGTMQKVRNFGFTVKNVYSHRIWVHANTPVGTPAALQTVYSRFCGFASKGRRVECVELAPGQVAKYNIPSAALTSAQAFMEFVAVDFSGYGMAKGRTMNLASLVIETPADYLGTDGLSKPEIGERKGGQLCTILPYVTYDYTELETEFKSIREGVVEKKQPFTLTCSNDIMDLYGVTNSSIDTSKEAWEELFLRKRVTLAQTDDGHLMMVLPDEDMRKVQLVQDGLEASIPALGIVKGGAVECQFKTKDGHAYLWDSDRDEPMVVNKVNKLPVTMPGSPINVHAALDAPGVYSINWGTFLENAAAAAWEIVKTLL